MDFRVTNNDKQEKRCVRLYLITLNTAHFGHTKSNYVEMAMVQVDLYKKSSPHQEPHIIAYMLFCGDCPDFSKTKRD